MTTKSKYPLLETVLRLRKLAATKEPALAYFSSAGAIFLLALALAVLSGVA